MKKCDACGTEINTCAVCGKELHLYFIDFIDKMEIIYAILLAWGFAEATRAVIVQSNWDFAPLLLIDALVFVRFFFAPERNLHSVALAAKDFPRWHWAIFLFDIPLLIFHSFSYYSMCVAIVNQKTLVFYQWLIILLTANVIWLISISARIKFFDKAAKIQVFPIWIINNFSHVLIFWIILAAFTGSPLLFFKLLFFSKTAAAFIQPGSLFYWLVFTAGLTNCCIDLIMASSDYMGFHTTGRNK